jgi:alpha-1,3-fucosyltransferase
MVLNEECLSHTCRLTTDRRLLNESDAVIFHFLNDKLDQIPTYPSILRLFLILSLPFAVVILSLGKQFPVTSSI